MKTAMKRRIKGQDVSRKSLNLWQLQPTYQMRKISHAAIIESKKKCTDLLVRSESADFCSISSNWWSIDQVLKYM